MADEEDEHGKPPKKSQPEKPPMRIAGGTDMGDPPAPWTAPGFMPTGEQMAWLWLKLCEDQAAEGYRVVGGHCLNYEGGIWHATDVADSTLANSIAGFCMDVGRSLRKAKIREKIEGFTMHRHMLTRARALLTRHADEFDQRHELIAFPSGVYNSLDEGNELLPHRKDYYFTKCCAIDPDWDMPTPIWDRFLWRIMNGDQELIDFLYRWYGYCMTGWTSEEKFTFSHGFGGNGKSVLINTVAGIMGSYASVASVDLFLRKYTDKHPEELASLRGVRMVIAEETDPGRHWDEAMIKRSVSAEKQRARFMRQNSFEFTPVWKLNIVGNHQPGISAVDDAMVRRFLLVPYNVTIGEAERNTRLAEDLRTEWPGIAAKLLDGLQSWRTTGLSPPPAVRAATSDYIEAEDAHSQWHTDCTIIDVDAWCGTTAAYGSWGVWAANHGEPKGTCRNFVQALRGHGFKPQRKNAARGFAGFRLKSVSEAEGNFFHDR